jgi:DNA-binding MurR/RpiR family transcriptional regulator
MGGAITEQASIAGPADLLIAISFPPYAADTLQVCDQVKKIGARRLAITDAFLSPIATDADVVLEVNDAKLLGFRSLTSAMSLAQALVVGLAFSKRSKRRMAGKTASKTSTGATAGRPPFADLLEVDC